MSTHIGSHVRRDLVEPAGRTGRVSYHRRLDLQGAALFVVFAALTIALTLLGCLGTSAPMAGG